MNVEALIVEHLDWCRNVSLAYVRGFPPEVDFSDVIQDGYVGLVKAARSFDPSRGALFTTWAYVRVRGEIADRLRQATPGPRRQAHDGAELARIFSLRYPLSLDEPLDFDDDELLTIGDAIEDPTAQQAFSEIVVRDLRDRLPARERFVLGLADEGYRLREIGDILHVTEGRVCQLRTRAHERMAA